MKKEQGNAMPVTVEPSGQVQMASSETLNLPLLAERIAHERELRLTSASYERQLREKADENERDTRELVARLRDEARANERDRIEERLTVLNNERARQEQDRASFATREATDIAIAAIGSRSTAAVKELADAVSTLQSQRERDLGRESGTKGVQSWLAPNLGSIIAIGASLAALYLFFNNGGL